MSLALVWLRAIAVAYVLAKALCQMVEFSRDDELFGGVLRVLFDFQDGDFIDQFANGSRNMDEHNLRSMNENSIITH